MATREALNPTDWLIQEYQLRKRRNPKYSMRSFAQFLDIPPGPLSEIFANKRKLTESLGDRIAERLKLSKARKEKFLDLVRQELKAEALTRRFSRARANAPDYEQISHDTFELIAEWHHFAILALMKTEGFRSDPAWIASRLRLMKTDVERALQRLERLGFIQREGDDIHPRENLASPGEIPSEALRKHHRETLDRAKVALEAVPIDLRDITSITMAVDRTKLPVAKQAIEKFRRELASILENGERQDVFQLTITLVPVSEVNVV